MRNVERRRNFDNATFVVRQTFAAAGEIRLYLRGSYTSPKMDRRFGEEIGKDEAMVWRMALPDSFGTFFPNCSYVGWREELKRYLIKEMPDEQKALFIENGRFYPSYAKSKFADDPTRQRLDHPPSLPIAAHEPPKRFVLERTYTSLGSLINTEDRILAIDESLREVIERFEPGVHSFFPLEITMLYLGGPQVLSEDYPKRFFVFVVCQYIDSFLP